MKSDRKENKIKFNKLGRAAAHIYKIFDCDNNAVFGQQKN